MTSAPDGYRAEFIYYQRVLEPRMYHLGEVFAAKADAVQHWAGERALEIATAFSGEEEQEAEIFRSWSERSSTEATGRRLRQGEAVVFSCVGSECTWELSLRPVPVSSLQGNGPAQHPYQKGASQ